VKLFEAIRLSKSAEAILRPDAPESIIRPAVAAASASGIEFLSIKNEHRKLIWTIARMDPEASLLYRSESWEPIDPKTGLEVLAGL